MLSIAFSPEFASDSRVYIFYNAPPRSDEFKTRMIVSRFQVVDGVLSMASEEILIDLDDRFWWHNGGQLAFGPDGYLYVAMGDGGTDSAVSDPDGRGQNLQTLLGSILRLDVSGDGGYTIPAGNPFADGPGGNADEIYAHGFRNPWRFSFDRETGNIWAADVGFARWEEVDQVVRGGNYGWNVMEGPTCFGVVADACDKTPYILPRAAYGHGQEVCTAIIGGFVYRGSEMPELNGWYVYGDFCSGKIWAFDTASDTSPAILLVHSGASISSFAELPDGEILVLTFDNAIYGLARAQAGP